MNKKSQKIGVWTGPEGPGARSGSHGGPQGSTGTLKRPKTTFERHAGTPLWEAIFGTFFRFFGVFVARFSEGGFGGLPGSI